MRKFSLFNLLRLNLNSNKNNEDIYRKKKKKIKFDNDDLAVDHSVDKSEFSDITNKNDILSSEKPLNQIENNNTSQQTTNEHKLNVIQENEELVRKPQLRKKKSEHRVSLSNRLSSNVSSNALKRYSADFNTTEIAYIYKILIIGNSGVGKTSIMNRFCDNVFISTYIDTIGVDYKTKIIRFKPQFTIDQNNNHVNSNKLLKRNSAFVQSSANSDLCYSTDNSHLKIKLQIWDTAGNQRFYSLTKNYYRGANGILLVYDVSDRKTFENIKFWMKTVCDHCTEHVETYLIANKCDTNYNSTLISQVDDVNHQLHRKVSRQEGEALAQQYGIKYIETSAKSNINIENVFLNITKSIKTKMEKQFYQVNQTNKNESKKQQQQKQAATVQLRNNTRRYTDGCITSKRKLSNMFFRSSLFQCFMYK